MPAIFFTGSARNYNKMRPIYKSIIDIIGKLGGTLTWDVVSSIDDLIRSNVRELSQAQWQEIYKNLLHALENSDLIILENTTSAFSTGYLAGIAISLKIPTLILKDANAQHTFKTTFIEGIVSPYLSLVKYKSLDDIYKAIKNFIINNTINVPKSFHLKLSPNEKRFIERMARKLGISKIKYIRKLISDAMLKSNEIK